MMMPKHLLAATAEEISLSVDNLCVVYKGDFDRADMNAELSQLKTWLPRILEDDPDEAGPLGVLNAIMNFGMVSVFVNVCTAIRIFLTLPVTVASAERSFSKLKLIKNYLGPTMNQERLSGLAIMSIEYEAASQMTSVT